MIFVLFVLSHTCLEIIVFSSSSPAEIGIPEALTSEFSESIITDIFGRQRRRALSVAPLLSAFLEVYV